jgi:hypothetical protein
MTTERKLAEYYNERAKKNRQRFIYSPGRRFLNCLERHNGAATAAATVAIAALTVSLSFDSGRQAETANEQFKIMRGQLEEMKIQSAITRSQVRANLTLSFGKTLEQDDVFVTPTFQNAGESEALNFTGWDDSQFFTSPFPRDFDFLKRRSQYPLAGRSIARNDSMHLPSRLVSKEEIRKLLSKEGFVIVWGHGEFADIFKTQHHSDFCVSVGPSPDGSDVSFSLLKSECNGSD